jgi:integrase
MPRRRIPSYRHYKPKDLGLVVLNGRYHYLGKYGTPESLAEYHRLVQEWLVCQQTQPPRDGQPPDLTVNALILAFLKHANQHYRHPDGSSTGEFDNLRDALRPLRQLYGHTVAKDFGPLALRAVQQEMIRAGLCRTVINDRVKRIRRAFRWGVSVELVPAAVIQALETVPALKRGRCAARESEGVKPVHWGLVEATLPFLPRPVAAMVQVMRYSNCRAQDVVLMRGCDLRMDGEVWTFRPVRHKNQWREQTSESHSRVIYLGPRCQEVLRPFLTADPRAYLFSPVAARAQYQARRAALRKTTPTPSELRRRRKPNPRRAPRERYDVNSFQQSVRKACQRAGLPVWTVLQVRHTRGTEVRESFGVEGAQATLGHARVETTQIYAEKNQQLARQIAREIG